MRTEEDRFALFDGDNGSAILLSDYRRTVSFDGGGSLEATFCDLEAAAAQGEWVALAVDYGIGACFESAVPQSLAASPRLKAWVFAQARRLDAEAVANFFGERLAQISEHDRACGVAELASSLDAFGYATKVEQIRRWITEGDCYQINLTFPIDFRIYGHPLALYARLRERQPVRYGACIAIPGETRLSFSPELFFERTGHRVVTRPMKGTAPRGATPKEDALRRRTLLASEKERAENVMIVDLLRNDLGRLALPGKVRVDALCEAEAYPTLWQVVSTISADLPGVSLFDLFRALFPCGSITGAPKIRAIQCIETLENSPRGLYTGALGWLAPGGDCRFNVAIRTLEVASDGRARLGVGSGIVIDAKPENEYAECLLKARFLTGFDPGFELIETMRMEHGACPLLELHLQRLEASALALGFSCDVPSVRAALSARLSGCDSGVFRIRLALAHDGHCRLDVAAMKDEPRLWRVVLADELLDPDDYLLRHKTTVRYRYDRTLAGLPDGVFDAIFLNVRGEVCEGARSNIFVERDGQLLTPPRSSGLLPGVMRRSLLESGRAVERVLTRDDLLGATSIYLANALRGLFPVRLKT